MLISSGSGTEYYQVGPYKWLGDIDSTGEYEVATSSTLLPATATVGQAGALIVSTQYTSNLKTSVVYNETTTWSLEADTANTAWFCMNSTVVYTDGVTPNFNEADCYKIDVNGNVLGYRMTISQGTSTLTFQ